MPSFDEPYGEGRGGGVQTERHQKGSHSKGILSEEKNYNKKNN
jgi:hypothetical protein